jgi:hypothetical protein
MKQMTFRDELIEMGACQSAIDWVGDRTERDAWAECERADWMLWLAPRCGWGRREDYVRCAILCAAQMPQTREWLIWAEGWISGRDRSEASARAIAKAKAKARAWAADAAAAAWADAAAAKAAASASSASSASAWVGAARAWAAAAAAAAWADAVAAKINHQMAEIVRQIITPVWAEEDER